MYNSLNSIDKVASFKVHSISILIREREKKIILHFSLKTAYVYIVFSFKLKVMSNLCLVINLQQF